MLICLRSFVWQKPFFPPALIGWWWLGRLGKHQEKAAGDSVWGNPKPCTDFRFYEAAAILSHFNGTVLPTGSSSLFAYMAPSVWLSKTCKRLYFSLEKWKMKWFVSLSDNNVVKKNWCWIPLLNACECQIHLHLVLYIIFFNRKYLKILAFKCLTDILCINLSTPNSILL